MKDATEKERLQRTLLLLASPNVRPDELLKVVRKHHPNASKSDIIRAAFAVIINAGEGDIERVMALQNFAIKERGPEDR